MNATPVIDLPLASAGSIFALSLASQLAAAYGDVLVVASEKMSSVINGAPLDQNTAILFGDGAGAALVSTRAGRFEILDSVLHTDGAFRDDLAPGMGNASKNERLDRNSASRQKLPAVIDEILKRQNISPAEVAPIRDAPSQSKLNHESGESPAGRDQPILFKRSKIRQHLLSLNVNSRLRVGTNPGPVIFAGFGAGFNWGALIARSV